VVAEPDRLRGDFGQHPAERWAGRFSRRIRGWAKANRVPRIDGRAGERKHHLAEELLKTTAFRPGLFLILVRKAQAPVGEVSGSGTQHHLERKKPMNAPAGALTNCAA